MIINHSYSIPDIEFLNKYGVKPLSDERELADQSLILYSFRKGLPFAKFFQESTKLNYSDWKSYSNTEKCSYMEYMRFKIEEDYGYKFDDIIANELLEKSTLTSNYRDLCEKTGSIPKDEFCREYPWLLITMFEQSRMWKENKLCTFEVLEVLKNYIDQFNCEIEFCMDDQNYIAAAMFDDSNKYNDGFVMLVRESLPREFLFKPSNNPCEYFLIGDESIGWNMIKYQDRYDSLDRAIIPTMGSIESDLVKQFIHYGELSEVIGTYSICDQLGSFGKIIVLNFWGRGDSLRFLKSSASNIVEDEAVDNPVSYETIALFNYSLNPQHYQKPENPFNLPLVELGDICEIDKGANSKLGDRLPFYFFTSDFKRLCVNADHPIIDRYSGEISSSLYEGPHVHISLNQHSAFVSRTTGLYHCQCLKNIALRIKDNLVYDKYLAYVLTRDMGFQNFLITNPSEQALLHRKIAIYPNRSEQKAIVDRFLNSISADVLSNNYYNIVWIDSSFTEDKAKEISSDLEDKKLNVVWLESVNNQVDYLNNLLRQTDKQKDAVIIDAKVDSIGDRLKGLRKAMSICDEYKIPIYVYTDLDQSVLGIDLDEDQFEYLLDGRFFSKESPIGFDNLIRSIRRELDSCSNETIKLRSQFRQVFLAAEWLDDNLRNLNLASDLYAAIQNPNKSLNVLRGSLRRLYQEIVSKIGNGSGLEYLNLGAIPALLDDGYYKDKNVTRKVYIIKGNVLPKTLSRSLRFATDIVNGGSHSETVDNSKGRLPVNVDIREIGSDNIAWAVIRIVMDLVLYLKQIEFKFNGYCEAIDPNVKQTVNWIGAVSKNGDGDYYCVTDTGVKVHLGVDKYRLPIVDSKIKIKAVYPESKLIDQYQYFASPSDYSSC